MKLPLPDAGSGLFFLFACLVISPLFAQTGPLEGVAARPYDHHVEVNWERPADPAVSAVRVYGAREGAAAFTLLGATNNNATRYVHFVGDSAVTTRYFLRAVGSDGRLGTPSDTVTARTYEMSDLALLDMVQEYTLRYFYEYGHPTSGLARERNGTNTVTSGGTGFGLMALIVGAERGFITRDEALERTNRIVDFLIEAPRFHGAFAHWMNGSTGAVIPFSALDDGGDLVETAFLLQGLLTSRQYFSGEGEAEARLRANVNTLWEGVDWNWYRKQTENVLYWHWSPTNGFAINLPIRGFNETHIVYLLAAASPTPAYRIAPALYRTGWAGGSYTTNAEFYGIPLIVGQGKGGPLFFTHYSYLGFDPRGIRDAYANYFERNTNQARINYLHAQENPYNRAGYGPGVWGLTASDDPDGYLAHAPDNAQLDNGTITPTAALASMPYTPEESMAALKHMYRELGDRTWGEYGFYDAFNIGRDWYADSYLAIDQGPIVVMLENYRSGLLWHLFMSSPEIAPALESVGFVADNTTATQAVPDYLGERPRLYPNPATDVTRLHLNLVRPETVTVILYDRSGRRLRVLQTATALNAGPSELTLHPRPAAPTGMYYVRIESANGSYALPLLLR